MLLLSLTGVSACGLLRSRSPEPVPQVAVVPATPVEVARQCPEHPSIAAWERRLRTPIENSETKRGLERGAKYLPRLRGILAREGISKTLALLPLMESKFDVHAEGRFQERGLWQLRPLTAERFGLSVDPEKDDRLHPARATRAAAAYLRHLHRRYRNWPLALAAYNAGERRVDKALALHPKASFWQLADQRALPTTTRDYVPRFIALLRIVEGARGCHSPLV